MAKRRFIAPARHVVEAARFSHPIYAGFDAYRGWCLSPQWPDPATLNAAMPAADRYFALQDQALLADGLHYETRIAEQGAIATRTGNWHDLFNAMIWCRYPAIKRALNARQIAHIATMGPSQRNRAQYALTQFDEAGAIVRIRDPALLALWDRHDWTALFHHHAASWRSGEIRIAAVIGHALLEMALVPELFPVGKCLVVLGGDDDLACVSRVADAIAAGRVLGDPQDMRPLPLAGIPGWRHGQDADFYASAGCFQPLRAERVYPAAL
jgi:hypothetical protein